MAAPK